MMPLGEPTLHFGQHKVFQMLGSNKTESFNLTLNIVKLDKIEDRTKIEPN